MNRINIDVYCGYGYTIEHVLQIQYNNQSRITPDLEEFKVEFSNFTQDMSPLLPSLCLATVLSDLNLLCTLAGLQCPIFLAQYPKSWDCRFVPPCPSFLFLKLYLKFFIEYHWDV